MAISHIVFNKLACSSSWYLQAGLCDAAHHNGDRGHMIVDDYACDFGDDDGFGEYGSRYLGIGGEMAKLYHLCRLDHHNIIVMAMVIIMILL